MKEIAIYWPGDSVMHNLDPRLKVGGMLWLSLMLTMTDWRGLILASIGMSIMVYSSKLPPKLYYSSLIMLIWLGIFYLIAGGWFWNSWYFWQGHWSVPGLMKSGLIIWRIALLFTLTRLFSAVTPALEQGLGIAYLLTPLIRLTPKAADLALLITLTLRFIPLLIEEIGELGKARAAKGSLPESWYGKVIELVNLLPPLILLSLRRAEETADNLMARGYASGKYRTLSTHNWEKNDSWAAIVAGISGIVLLILK